MDLSHDRTSRLVVIAACALQAVLYLSLAATNLPLCDEGFYGVPAHYLAADGRLRNPVLESAGVPYLSGVDRIFHWMPPLGMAIQAAAFRVFGFGLFTQRAVSVVSAVSILLLWFFALRRLFPAPVAAIAVVILSCDHVFYIDASRGRSDMMSLFFSVLGLTAYLALRESSLPWALLAGHACCAASGLIHPNGGLTAAVALLFTMLYFDRSRMRLSYWFVAALPYLVFAMGWWAYISRDDPKLWVAQFWGNVHGRLSTGRFGLRSVTGEITRFRDGFPGILLVVPFSYLAAVVGCACLVRAGTKRYAADWLLLLFVAEFLSLVLFEPTRQPWYIVHLLPSLSALLAVWLAWLWQQRRSVTAGFGANPEPLADARGSERSRDRQGAVVGYRKKPDGQRSSGALRWLALAQMAVLLLSVGSSAVNIWNRRYQRLYVPLVEFLNANVKPAERVFGRSELYFALNCKRCLRDDERLGANSGISPDFIVIDPDYRAQFESFELSEPGVYRHIQTLLSGRYSVVYRNDRYEVLRRLD